MDRAIVYLMNTLEENRDEKLSEHYYIVVAHVISFVQRISGNGSIRSLREAITEMMQLRKESEKVKVFTLNQKKNLSQFLKDIDMVIAYMQDIDEKPFYYDSKKQVKRVDSLRKTVFQEIIEYQKSIQKSIV